MQSSVSYSYHVSRGTHAMFTVNLLPMRSLAYILEQGGWDSTAGSCLATAVGVAIFIVKVLLMLTASKSRIDSNSCNY